MQILSINKLYAQNNDVDTVDYVKEDKSKKSFDIKDKFFAGGNFGLQFGNMVLVDISPLVGYRVTNKLSVGLGFTYTYFKNYDIHYSTSIYGGRLFSRYFILDNLFLHGEYEILNGEWRYNDRFNITSILAGAGYRQPIGSSAAFDIMALWNFNESVDSPYSNPIIRAGFVVGF